jgi:beta-lactamase regulating signal transducer with metallopeptidase domain
LVIWLTGVFVISVRWLIGWIGIRVLAQHSQRIANDDWRELLEDVVAQLDLKQSVQLLQAKGATVPMTWGYFGPSCCYPWMPIHGRVSVVASFCCTNWRT